MESRAPSRLLSCAYLGFSPHSTFFIRLEPRKFLRPYTTVQKARKPSSKRLEGSRPRDQYAIKQAEQRKLANLSRQEALKAQYAERMRERIRGGTNPYVEFARTGSSTGVKPATEQNSRVENSEGRKQLLPTSVRATKISIGNYGLNENELSEASEEANNLRKPLEEPDRSLIDPTAEAEAAREHEEQHKSASAAMERITSLSNASSNERVRATKKMIRHDLGRHNTDTFLKPKAPSLARLQSTKPLPKPTPRAGPDTGSSEVQIGNLTVKINILADRLEEEGGKDKVNKRNLRLLLHRRQKLMKYMERKERGSERWFHMLKTLGLSEAHYKGEIEVR